MSQLDGPEDGRLPTRHGPRMGVVATLADVARVFALSLLLPTLVAIFSGEISLALAFGAAP